MNPKLTHRKQGFTLVEIMIVVAIIALLAAIAVPNFLRARKRSQASTVLNDLRLIQAAVDQYATDYSKPAGASVAWTDVQLYLKTDTRLYSSNCTDILGNSYGGTTGTLPPVAEQNNNGDELIPIHPPSPDTAGAFVVDGQVEFSGSTFAALSDVAPPDFWAPWMASNNF